MHQDIYKFIFIRHLLIKHIEPLVADVFMEDGCDAFSMIPSNLVHYSANIATIVTILIFYFVLFYFCLTP